MHLILGRGQNTGVLQLDAMAQVFFLSGQGLYPDLMGFYRCVCRWCSLVQVSTERRTGLVYTTQYSQGMLLYCICLIYLRWSYPWLTVRS